MKYGWEEVGLKSLNIYLISGKVKNTGRKVKPIGYSERTIYKDEGEQEWIKIRGLWWRFPEEVEF